MVTITEEEYLRLKEDSKLLEACRSHGVDNWEGFGDALREVYGENE